MSPQHNRSIRKWNGSILQGMQKFDRSMGINWKGGNETEQTIHHSVLSRTVLFGIEIQFKICHLGINGNLYKL